MRRVKRISIAEILLRCRKFWFVRYHQVQKSLLSRSLTRNGETRQVLRRFPEKSERFGVLLIYCIKSMAI